MEKITKLTSRKFIIAVCVIIINVLSSADNGSIIAGAVACIYMISEAMVDRARAVKREMKDIASVEKYLSEGGENENK